MKSFTKFLAAGALSTLCCALCFDAVAQRASDKALEDQVLSGKTPENDYTSPPPSTEELPQENDSTSTRKVEKPVTKVRDKDVRALDEALVGPKQIPFEQILVVQRRYVQKEGRHELTPLMLGIQPADSFRKQVQWGFSYTYHFTESLGVEALHVAFLTNFNTGLADTIRSSANLETKRVEPVLSAGSAILWTPLHSKAATADGVYHFEGYFIGGGGFTRTEDSTVGLAMAGIGFRAYMSKDSIFKAELRDYIDFTKETSYRLTLLIGASLLFGGGS